MEGALFVQQLRTERLEKLSVRRMGMQGPIYQDNSNKMCHFQGTIILEKFRSQLCSKLYFFVPKHFKYFTLHNCMKNEKSE